MTTGLPCLASGLVKDAPLTQIKGFLALSGSNVFSDLKGKHSMRRAALKWLVIANVIICLNAQGWAQDAGKTEYFWSCAACQNAGGKGNGPLAVAEQLTNAPPNLTVLAKNNNGVFHSTVSALSYDPEKVIRIRIDYLSRIQKN